MDGTVKSRAATEEVPARLDDITEDERGITKIDHMGTGQAIRFRTPYTGRDGRKQGLWQYARVGKKDQFHSASGASPGYQLHDEVRGGSHITTVSQAQLDLGEIEIQWVFENDVTGKEFSFQNTKRDHGVIDLRAFQHAQLGITLNLRESEEELTTEGYKVQIECNISTPEGLEFYKEYAKRVGLNNENHRLTLDKSHLKVWMNVISQPSTSDRTPSSASAQ